MKEIKDKIEAVMFALGRKVDLDEISTITKVTDKKVIEESLKELQEEYSKREGSVGLIQQGTLWKMGIVDEHIPTVQNIISDTELDKQTMETLAIIAYKAPVLQSNVIKIRTNKAYDHLKLLEELGYITREISGRTKLVKLSQYFFKYFDVPTDQMKQLFNNVEEGEKIVEEKEQELKDMKEQVKELEKQKKIEAKEAPKKEQTEEQTLEQVDAELLQDGVINESEEDEPKEAYEIELEAQEKIIEEKLKLKKEKEKRKQEREAKKAAKEGKVVEEVTKEVKEETNVEKPEKVVTEKTAEEVKEETNVEKVVKEELSEENKETAEVEENTEQPKDVVEKETQTETNEEKPAEESIEEPEQIEPKMDEEPSEEDKS